MTETKTRYNEGGPMVPASTLLPTDAFEKTFRDLTGHPDGAHTQPTVIKLVDFYGNTTDFIVQTVRWADGETVFLTIVDGPNPAKRVMLPPKVVNTILRQRDALATKVRRRTGKRLAAERKAAGILPGFLKNPGTRRRKKGR